MNALDQPPTEELKRMFFDLRRQQAAKFKLAQDGLAALPPLIRAMKHRTGQSYVLRSLLYSLWNGKPAALIDVLRLDPDLRAHLVAVVAGFGFDHETARFWYDDIKKPLQAAGLFEWFVEEGDNHL